MGQIKWTAIEHSGSKVKGQGKHVSLVAYEEGKNMNDVIAVFPMYDIRDMNLNGSVSWLEAGFSTVTNLYDPVFVFQIIKAAGDSSFLADTARQLDDWFLWEQARRGMLESVFKLRKAILTATMLQTFISPHLQLNLAKSGLAELNKIGGVAIFMVKASLEKAIMKLVLTVND